MEEFVYIPGKRDDRVLLVAHADGVHGKVKVGFEGGVYFSVLENSGINADDRAGCTILNQLKKSGHSLLITTGEERGGVGAKFLMRDKKMADEMQNHRWAIEFDRMNSHDMVYYQVATEEFKKWCESKFVGYKNTYGSYTDICEVCRDICGVNISVGYYGQHGSREILVESEFENTLMMARQVLSNNNIPKFKLTKPVYPTYTGYHNHHCGYNDDYDEMTSWRAFDTNTNTNGATNVPLATYVSDSGEEKETQTVSHIFEQNLKDKFTTIDISDIIICEKCGGIQDKSEFDLNNRCVFKH